MSKIIDYIRLTDDKHKNDTKAKMAHIRANQNNYTYSDIGKFAYPENTESDPGFKPKSYWIDADKKCINDTKLSYFVNNNNKIYNADVAAGKHRGLIGNIIKNNSDLQAMNVVSNMFNNFQPCIGPTAQIQDNNSKIKNNPLNEAKYVIPSDQVQLSTLGEDAFIEDFAGAQFAGAQFADSGPGTGKKKLLSMYIAGFSLLLFYLIFKINKSG